MTSISISLRHSTLSRLLLAEQYTLKAQKGGLAATPGKSNHGWGLAVDICGLQPGTSRWTWM